MAFPHPKLHSVAPPIIEVFPVLKLDQVSNGRLSQEKNQRHFQIISSKSVHGRYVRFSNCGGGGGGGEGGEFANLDKWPLIRGFPTALTE